MNLLSMPGEKLDCAGFSFCTPEYDDRIYLVLEMVEHPKGSV